MSIIETDWRRRFMSLALHVSSWSKDPSTKVGSVITDEFRRVVGLGYNGFPRGVIDAPDRYENKEVKYKMIVHGEANAILNAIASVRHATLYSTKHPCSDCVKLIIQSGIARIVCPAPSEDGIWAEDSRHARQMLREAGVIVDTWAEDP